MSAEAIQGNPEIGRLTDHVTNEHGHLYATRVNRHPPCRLHLAMLKRALAALSNDEFSEWVQKREAE